VPLFSRARGRMIATGARTRAGSGEADGRISGRGWRGDPLFGRAAPPHWNNITNTIINYYYTYQPEFFLILKIRKNEENQNEKGIFTERFFIFFLKTIANFVLNGNVFCHILDYNFSLVKLFWLVFLLFRNVLKTCCCLMLNSYWDVCQWHNIIILKRILLLSTSPFFYWNFTYFIIKILKVKWFFQSP
jgi:hypothetical protein